MFRSDLLVSPASALVLSSSQSKKQTYSLQSVLLVEDSRIFPSCKMAVGGSIFGRTNW